MVVPTRARLEAVAVVRGVIMIIMALDHTLCRWFAALKQRRNDAWLSYL